MECLYLYIILPQTSNSRHSYDLYYFRYYMTYTSLKEPHKTKTDYLYHVAPRAVKSPHSSRDRIYTQPFVWKNSFPPYNPFRVGYSLNSVSYSIANFMANIRAPYILWIPQSRPWHLRPAIQRTQGEFILIPIIFNQPASSSKLLDCGTDTLGDASSITTILIFTNSRSLTVQQAT